MQNTNYSSPNSRQPHSELGLKKSIRLLLGRSLVSTGGRIQGLGADLILRAEANDPVKLNWRVSFYGMIGAAAAILVVFLAWDASGMVMNERNPIQRAKAW